MRTTANDVRWIRALVMIMLALCGGSPAFAQLDRFTGNWTNVDPSTRGIAKVSVTVAANGIEVHVWGTCQPTDCDWGAAEGYAYASAVEDGLAAQARSISAIYRTGFSEIILVMHADGSDQLQIESLTRFLDNSGRTSYSSVTTFARTAVQ